MWWILEFLANPWLIWIMVGILAVALIAMVAEFLLEAFSDSPLFHMLGHSWSVNKWEPETRRAMRWVMPLWMIWTFLTYVPVAIILGTLIGLDALKDSIKSFTK